MQNSLAGVLCLLAVRSTVRILPVHYSLSRSARHLPSAELRTLFTEDPSPSRQSTTHWSTDVFFNNCGPQIPCSAVVS
jgi:hypothetical protein